MDNLRVGAHTFGFVWEQSAVKCIELLARRGFDLIEILAAPGHLDIWADLHATATQLERALVAQNARILAFDLPAHDFNLASLDARAAEFSICAYERLISLAGAVGAPWVTVHGGRRIGFYPPPDELPYQALRRSMDRLVTTAQRNSVRLIIENIVPALLNTAKTMNDFVNLGGWPDVSFIYDVANAAPLREDPAEAIACLSSRLAVVHLSDCAAGAHQHAPIGSGVIDFSSIAAALREIAFQGDVILEIASSNPLDDLVDGKLRLVRDGWGFA